MTCSTRCTDVYPTRKCYNFRVFYTSHPMKLIGIPTSPYVRKTRIVLIEKKIEYEFVVTDLNSPDNIATRYNPLGKVPCLVMDDGKVLYDSRVIVDYLDTTTPVGKLLPEGNRARTDVKCWEALADGIMDAAILVRLESKRPAAQQSREWVRLQTGKIHSGLKALSEQLGNRFFCHENSFSLADIATGCALGWLDFRFPEIAWKKDYDNLARFFERLSERPSFRQTVPQ